jgi:hypothetical protein
MEVRAYEEISRGQPMTALTVTVGPQTNKARALHVEEQQGQRAVVSIPQKPTGVSAINTRAGLTSTYPGEQTRQSWQALLSLRSPGQSITGADNERSRH